MAPRLSYSRHRSPTFSWHTPATTAGLKTFTFTPGTFGCSWLPVALQWRTLPLRQNTSLVRHPARARAVTRGVCRVPSSRHGRKTHTDTHEMCYLMATSDTCLISHLPVHVQKGMVRSEKNGPPTEPYGPSKDLAVFCAVLFCHQNR